jgi:hypothetical protein
MLCRDIAMGCIYLASPAADFVTGCVLVVDGGAWMYRPPIIPREVHAGLLGLGLYVAPLTFHGWLCRWTGFLLSLRWHKERQRNSQCRMPHL